MSEKNINILHLQNYLNISCGVTRTISQIIKNASPEFEHHLIALDGDGLRRFSDFGFNPIFLQIKRNSIVGTAKIFLTLSKYCKNNSIQIIHSHHRYFDFVALLLSQILKIRTITSVQSKTFGKRILSYKSDALIACSVAINNHLLNYYKVDQRRITVIPNMVDPQAAILFDKKTELLNELNISSDQFIIGYFGRMDYQEKGVDILLKSFFELKRINNNLFLLLVGNGVDEEKIKTFIIQNELNAKLILSQNNIFNYYQLLNLFVLPSRIEPFGIVVLEAGLMKIPFIGSNVDGIAELIEHDKTGLLFESRNVHDLKTQILRILNDKILAKKLAENLNKKVLESYTIDKIIPQYEEIYLDVVRKS